MFFFVMKFGVGFGSNVFLVYIGFFFVIFFGLMYIKVFDL